MKPAIRAAVVAAYILLCIVLGGSTQGYWGVAILQLLAIAIIGWSLLTPDRLCLSGPDRGDRLDHGGLPRQDGEAAGPGKL